MTVLIGAGLRKVFQGVAAVDGVDINVGEREILGLIGPNGAGKTTLFNLLSGTIRPDEGTVTLDGVEITGWPSYRVARSGLIRTFQIARPFNGVSVLENVAIGALQHSESMDGAFDVAERVLDDVGLANQAAAPAATLTEGDRKRLEMAKALAARPEVLLLDEILAGLAVSDVQSMLDLIGSVRDRGIAVVLIEHRVQAVVDLVDRMVVLHVGRVLFEGTPAEVVAAPEVIDIYLGRRHHGDT